MCESGRKERKTSSRYTSYTASAAFTFCSMFWWESITPLGRPVVPDVYTIVARALPSTFARGRSSALRCPVGERDPRGSLAPAHAFTQTIRFTVGMRSRISASFFRCSSPSTRSTRHAESSRQ
jgi:hypothetical protein